MYNTRLATRYARSLITLAEDKSNVETVLEDMKYLFELCNQSREFSLMLRSPIIKSDKKLAIVKAVLKDKLSPLSSAFIELLIKKGREFFLGEMAESYISQYKAMKHIHDVCLTTAVKISDDLSQAIKARVESSIKEGKVDLKLKS